MERSIIFTALGALAALLERDEATNVLNKKQVTSVNGAYKALGEVLDNVGVVVTPPAPTEPQTIDDSDEDGQSNVTQDDADEESILEGVEFDSKDPYISQAFLAIHKESKPTVGVMTSTLKKRGVRLGAKRYQSLFDELIDGGHIRVTKSKKEKNPAAAVKPTSEDLSLEELLGQLPTGDHLLVSEPFKYLIALEEKDRKQYLKGLDITEYVTSDSVGEGTERGVDLSLVNQIIKLADKERKPVKKVLQNIGVKGDEQGQKYMKHIANCISVIPSGDILFNHMAAKGANKQVLKDLQTVAKAIKSGQLT